MPLNVLYQSDKGTKPTKPEEYLPTGIPPVTQTPRADLQTPSQQWQTNENEKYMHEITTLYTNTIMLENSQLLI